MRLFRRAGWMIGVMLAAFVFGCGSESESTSGVSDDVAAEIETFTMEHYLGDVPRWKLVADRSRVLTTETAIVENPRVVIYENGVPTVTITGEVGEVDQKTFDLKITRKVRAVSKDAVLLTEELLWSDADGKLTAPTDVEIHRGDSVVYGDRMVGYPDLNEVTLEGVRFYLLPQDEKIEEYPLHDPESE